MSATQASQPKDANRAVITTIGPVVSKSIILTGNGATVYVPIFTLTGTIEIIALYGVVTTAIGVNHTAASWRINDQTAQVYLTAVGGTTLSGIAAGSMIVKKGVVATALSKIDNVAGAILEPTTLETGIFTPIVITKKTGALTQIEYQYTTSDTPTTGAIQFFCGFTPLSSDGDLTVV